MGTMQPIYSFLPSIHKFNRARRIEEQQERAREAEVHSWCWFVVSLVIASRMLQIIIIILLLLPLVEYTVNCFLLAEVVELNAPQNRNLSPRLAPTMYRMLCRQSLSLSRKMFWFSLSILLPDSTHQQQQSERGVHCNATEPDKRFSSGCTTPTPTDHLYGDDDASDWKDWPQSHGIGLESTSSSSARVSIGKWRPSLAPWGSAAPPERPTVSGLLRE